jgi:hypothetical protein
MDSSDMDEFVADLREQHIPEDWIYACRKLGMMRDPFQLSEDPYGKQDKISDEDEARFEAAQEEYKASLTTEEWLELFSQNTSLLVYRYLSNIRLMKCIQSDNVPWNEREQHAEDLEQMMAAARGFYAINRQEPVQQLSYWQQQVSEELRELLAAPKDDQGGQIIFTPAELEFLKDLQSELSQRKAE